LDSFDPVLEAKPEGKPEAEKRRLDHVQDATRATINDIRDELESQAKALGVDASR